MFTTEKKYLERLNINYEVVRNDLLNLRCPICGDSNTNEYKKRGYVIHKDDSVFYTCHNECGSMSFIKFLKNQNETLAMQYKSETTKQKFKEKKQNKEVFKKKSVLTTKKFDGKSVTIKLKDKDTKVKLFDFKVSPKAKAYLKTRGFSLKDVEKYGWYYTKELNAIVFPLYSTSRKDEIYGVQIRLIEKKHFINITYDDNFKYWGEFLIDSLPYGSELYVFESIFDCVSSGLDNAIAVLGADLSDEVLEKFKNYNIIFCFDNDEAGVEKTIKYSNKGYSCLIHGTKFPFKDLNDLKKRGVDQEKITAYVTSHIKSPKMSVLKARLKANYDLFEW